MRAVNVVLLLSGFALGCSESALEPSGREKGLGADTRGSSAAPELRLLTRNLYVGTDVDVVISALRSDDPNDDVPALLGAIGTLGRTNFPVRAAAIADEIAEVRPHAVGLQEVSKIDLTLPGVDLHQDFLPTILAELAARGLDYQVAAQIKNIEAAPLPGVSLVDFDVLLVRDGIQVGATTAQNFAANLGVVAPGVTLKRGWVTAVVTIDGTELTLASSHLESGNVEHFDELRAAQAQELAASLDPAQPAVLMGDLNDAPGSLMYQVLVGHGLVDVWKALRPGVEGNTCCYLADLSNQIPDLTQRLDYIFARGLDRPHAGLQGKVELLGEVPADRLPTTVATIWPSDHAGLAAQLRLPTVGSTP